MVTYLGSGQNSASTLHYVHTTLCILHHTGLSCGVLWSSVLNSSIRCRMQAVYRQRVYRGGKADCLRPPSGRRSEEEESTLGLKMYSLLLEGFTLLFKVLETVQYWILLDCSVMCLPVPDGSLGRVVRSQERLHVDSAHSASRTHTALQATKLHSTPIGPYFSFLYCSTLYYTTPHCT